MTLIHGRYTYLKICLYIWCSLYVCDYFLSEFILHVCVGNGHSLDHVRGCDIADKGKDEEQQGTENKTGLAERFGEGESTNTNHKIEDVDEGKLEIEREREREKEYVCNEVWS